MEKLKAPFPWFGGKSRVADVVWREFGQVKNYVEPFFGSGAVLLGRPDFSGSETETVNDLDGYVCNFWRSIANDPEEVAKWADWPVNENDLHARHFWLAQRKADFSRRLEGDPDFFDPKVAGWWVWGICSWIGGEWCDSNGPWFSVDGLLIKRDREHNGVRRKLPHLSDGGQGIQRRITHPGPGRGVNRKTNGTQTELIYSWFSELSNRLRMVRVTCGDWSRVLGPSPTTKLGTTAIFLDPPYDLSERTSKIYDKDEHGLFESVREWAWANGSNPKLRIALCGYDDGSQVPDGWRTYRWKAHGGYGVRSMGRGRDNSSRETIWFSPYCVGESLHQSSLGIETEEGEDE
jgi:site-specific DNA-adenine methylase